ncbi:MAG: DUF445 family protein [Chitinophagaceae bacterium]
MNILVLFSQPFVAAFTGWFTTWIAIYMLFHPREPKKILGITFHGVFPKRQKQFAAKLGATVASELLHFDDIAEQIKKPGQLDGLMPGIEMHIDGFLQQRLKEKIPVLAMFLSDEMLQTIKAGLMEEIQAMLPQVISQFADSLGNKIDVEKMVREKVSAFSSDRLEGLLLAVMTKEFRFVELIGGVLGFVIGLVQVAFSVLA